MPFVPLALHKQHMCPSTLGETRLLVLRQKGAPEEEEEMKIEIKKASNSDSQILGEMNKRLIEDEKHSNPMTIPELVERMNDFLSDQYIGYIINANEIPVGYCLYRDDIACIYIRQLYIERDKRRLGLGRLCIEQLKAKEWFGRKLRIEVLNCNQTGISFWRGIGFHDYCITMEMK